MPHSATCDSLTSIAGPTQLVTLQLGLATSSLTCTRGVYLDHVAALVHELSEVANRGAAALHT